MSEHHTVASKRIRSVAPVRPKEPAFTRVQTVVRLLKQLSEEVNDLGHEEGYRVLQVTAKVEAGHVTARFAPVEGVYKIEFRITIDAMGQKMQHFGNFFRCIAIREHAPIFTADETQDIMRSLESIFGVAVS